MSEWQDIETAPRDGTTVLLALAQTRTYAGEVWAAFWHDGSKNHWRREGWYDEVDREHLLIAKPVQPDFWMPFPEPPKI
jgi:hypothetical protein